MEKYFLIVLSIFVCSCNKTNKNETDNTEKETKSKYENVLSKKGAIIKSVNYNLPNIKDINEDDVTTNVKKLILSKDTLYFYQIEKSNNAAFVEYSDLNNIISAIDSLDSSFKADLASKPDLLQNKYTTEDGFGLGYIISNDRSSWFIQFNSVLDNVVFISEDGSDLKQVIQNAKNKIDSLKKIK